MFVCVNMSTQKKTLVDYHKKYLTTVHIVLILKQLANLQT